MQKKADNNYISFLAVLSAIAVVYLHANGCFWDFSRERYWITANILECLFYFAVPVFFMIPGATLLNFFERYDLKLYIIKRIRKTVIPYIAWSAIGILFRFFYLKSISNISLKSLVKMLLDGDAVSIYWFFPVLFCVYLCIPLFAAVSQEKRKIVFTFLAIICFSLNIVIPFLLSVLSINYSFPYQIQVGSGYLFYVIVGYLLHSYDIKLKQRLSIYVLAFIGLLMHIIGTHYLSMEAGDIVQVFKGYNNLPCVLYSIGIFVFIKSIVKKQNDKKICALCNYSVSKLKKYTFAIYLEHWFLLQIIRNELPFDNHSIFYRILIPIPIILGCIIITFLLRKIPIIRNMVPE